MTPPLCRVEDERVNRSGCWKPVILAVLVTIAGLLVVEMIAIGMQECAANTNHSSKLKGASDGR